MFIFILNYLLKVDKLTSNFLKAVFHKFFLGPFLNTLTHTYNGRERKSNANPILHKNKNMNNYNKN